MNVGDVGVLCEVKEYRWLNGLPAKIVGVLRAGQANRQFRKLTGYQLFIPSYDGYAVRCVDGVIMSIGTHQIKPLRSPDVPVIRYRSLKDLLGGGSDGNS